MAATTRWSLFSKSPKSETQHQAIVDLKSNIKQSLLNDNLAECQEYLREYVRHGNTAYKDISDLLTKFGCDTKIIYNDPNAQYNPWVWNNMIAKIPGHGFSGYAKEFRQHHNNTEQSPLR